VKRFLVLFEKAGNNYSAYSPDLPGCIATGKTRRQAAARMRQAAARMRQAIQMHLEGLKSSAFHFLEVRFLRISSKSRKSLHEQILAGEVRADDKLASD
jgi:predicted RNase H-like HicB family nuclease